MLFIDFKQAFDSINRKQLCEVMHRFDLPTKLIKLTKMIMKNTKASINIGGKTGDTFKLTEGVKQGDSLSAVMFNIALHLVIASIDQ